MNARIDQLATKVNGIDATFGVKFEETNAKLDAASTKLDVISQRLPAEFKTIGVEIAAETSALAKNHRFHVRPSAVSSSLSLTRTCDRTKTRVADEGPAVTNLPASCQKSPPRLTLRHRSRQPIDIATQIRRRSASISWIRMATLPRSISP